jgi:hypothetical protein
LETGAGGVSPPADSELGKKEFGIKIVKGEVVMIITG